MNKDQALEILKQACASVVANLEQHKQIQLALAVIEGALKPCPTSQE